MKKEMFICLLIGLVIFCSCSQQDRRVQVTPSEELQKVIDSLVVLKNSEKKVYHLFVDQITPNQCFMVLYMGDRPFLKDSYQGALPYTKDVLSVYYFLSNGHEIRIYSGIESCFNFLEMREWEWANFEKIVLPWKEQPPHSFWVIHLYNNEVIEVYPTNGAIPFWSPPGG